MEGMGRTYLGTASRASGASVGGRRGKRWLVGRSEGGFMTDEGRVYLGLRGGTATPMQAGCGLHIWLSEMCW